MGGIRAVLLFSLVALFGFSFVRAQTPIEAEALATLRTYWGLESVWRGAPSHACQLGWEGVWCGYVNDKVVVTSLYAIPLNT